MKKILIILTLLTLILPIVVLASGTSTLIEIRNPITATSFEAIVGNGIDFIFKIAVVLAPLMVIISGFLLVTAGGNPDQVSRAKNILLWAVIGFLVILLSKGILAIINQILGVKG